MNARPPGQALEEDAAEREDVGARVEVAIAARLLRRHVARRAERGAGHRRGSQCHSRARCRSRGP